MICYIIQIISQCSIVFMPGGSIKFYYAMVGFNLLSGISGAGRYAIGYCYIMELSPKANHFALGTFYNVVDGLLTLWFTLYFMFVSKNWMWPQVWGVTQLIVSFVVFLIWIPESPKWLFDKGKWNELDKVFEYMAKINNYE